MKTTRFVSVFIAVIASLLAACGGPAPVAEPTAVIEQPPVVEPTAPPPPTTAPAEPPPAEPTQPQFAPFCQSAPTSCEAPTVTILDDKYCIEKVPYVIMSVAAGTTYESQDPDMQCVDQMHSDGTLRLTCHSVTNKDLVSYDLQVCNGACTAPSLQMGTGQCPEGYGYDSANSCCAAPAPASSNGCTTLTVDIRSCPEPQ
jgi:hypothetical protein